MMQMISTTPVPNVIFDKHLNKLKSAELKMLLVITRQTLGWRDINSQNGTNRKEKDWISASQLQKKTGSSRRAITDATKILVKRNLIKVLSQKGGVLKSPNRRRGEFRLIYKLSTACVKAVKKDVETSGEKQKIAQDISEKRAALVQNMRITN